MRRFGEPDDLVGTVLWLVSDASRFVTGIVVPVDGGFMAFSGVWTMRMTWRWFGPGDSVRLDYIAQIPCVRGIVGTLGADVPRRALAAGGGPGT